MFSRHAQVLCGLVFLLAACADSATTRTIAAPDAGPVFDVGAAPTFTELGTGEEISGTADVGAEQAATGGRASGHDDITLGTVHQKRSFIALTTGDFPNAKGQAEVHIVSTLGFTVVHADVDCLAILGNNAWVSGPVTKFRRNGEDLTILPGFQMLFRVQDNGEGATSVDMASVVVGSFTPQDCRFRRPLLAFMAPSDNGNIQVSEK
jgi:hypothetical protein